LNFDRSFEWVEKAAMPWDAPVVARFTTVIFASVIGGLLLSNQWDLRVEPLKVEASQATSASPEMMRLLRDEHDLVAQMVKAQLAVSDSSFSSKPMAVTARRQAIAMR
jgi:hypothetical protein